MAAAARGGAAWRREGHAHGDVLRLGCDSGVRDTGRAALPRVCPARARRGAPYCSANARSMTKSPGVEVLPSLKPRCSSMCFRSRSIAGLPQIITRSCAGSITGRPRSANSLPDLDQLRDAPHVAVALPRHGGVVAQLAGHQLAEELVARQVLDQQVVVGQLVDGAHAVHQHHLLELLVGLGVAHDAHERRQPGAGAQQVQAPPGQQVVDHQRAGGLAADDHGVAGAHVLQPRGQRAVRHLDAEELQVVFVVRADDAVGAQQRLVVDAQPEHREVAVGETQRRVARGGEGEQAVGPVVDALHRLFVECSHGSLCVSNQTGFQRWLRPATQSPSHRWRDVSLRRSALRALSRVRRDSLASTLTHARRRASWWPSPS